VSQLMTAGGREREREFQVAGAAQLKDRLPMSVRMKGTSRNNNHITSRNDYKPTIKTT